MFPMRPPQYLTPDRTRNRPEEESHHSPVVDRSPIPSIEAGFYVLSGVSSHPGRTCSQIDRILRLALGVLASAQSGSPLEGHQG